MISQCQMLFPFTTQKEILDWEDCYIKDQSENRRCKEQAVIDIKKAVKARKNPETPGGYLETAELRMMAGWKRHTLPSLIENNPDGHVEKITAEAFRPGDDWEKLEKLTALDGVRESVGSVILHLYDEGDYPILDKHALCSIGINHKKVNYDEPFWRKYVKFCREKADCHGVCMRTLDRALYKFSKSGAATALKTITDEMFFLELKRRGYDLSSLREKEDIDNNAGATAEIVKIG